MTHVNLYVCTYLTHIVTYVYVCVHRYIYFRTSIFLYFIPSCTSLHICTHVPYGVESAFELSQKMKIYLLIGKTTYSSFQAQHHSTSLLLIYARLSTLNLFVVLPIIVPMCLHTNKHIYRVTGNVVLDI